jgi:hypothetical protein
MTTLTIWKDQANKIQVVQLSDDPSDGTDTEQLDHLKTLSVYANLTCVSENYTGTFPDTDSSTWEWLNGAVVSKPVVPLAVSMRQARLALLGAGLLENVAIAIAGLPSPQKEAAQIEWEYSQEVHRNKELVSTLAPLLGLSEVQLDSLFITASTL